MWVTWGERSGPLRGVCESCTGRLPLRPRLSEPQIPPKLASVGPGLGKAKEGSLRKQTLSAPLCPPTPASTSLLPGCSGICGARDQALVS